MSASRTRSSSSSKSGNSKSLNDYVRSALFHNQWDKLFKCGSNWEIRWEKVLLARFIVRAFYIVDANESQSCVFGNIGALNLSTGETVAVKEIQLSNIPKSELPEIQVSLSLLSIWYLGFIPTECWYILRCIVWNRTSEELKRKGLSASHPGNILINAYLASEHCQV